MTKSKQDVFLWFARESTITATIYRDEYLHWLFHNEVLYGVGSQKGEKRED